MEWTGSVSQPEAQGAVYRPSLCYALGTHSLTSPAGSAALTSLWVLHPCQGGFTCQHGFLDSDPLISSPPFVLHHLRCCGEDVIAEESLLIAPVTFTGKSSYIWPSEPEVLCPWVSNLCIQPIVD